MAIAGQGKGMSNVNHNYSTKEKNEKGVEEAEKMCKSEGRSERDGQNHKLYLAEARQAHGDQAGGKNSS